MNGQLPRGLAVTWSRGRIAHTCLGNEAVGRVAIIKVTNYFVLILIDTVILRLFFSLVFVYSCFLIKIQFFQISAFFLFIVHSGNNNNYNINSKIYFNNIISIKPYHNNFKSYIYHGGNDERTLGKNLK